MRQIDSSTTKPRLWLIPLLILLGLILGWWQPFALSELLGWGRQVADSPLMLAVVVIAMMLLFSFGLPGSLGLWLIAPFQPPLVATMLLLTGSLGGALGAYVLSRRLHANWMPDGLAGRAINLLARRSDLMTQVALRALPGFPHAVINFAGGLLKLPLLMFLLSALIGLSIKWSIYASAVYGLAEAAETDGAIEFSSLAPLLLLSVLLMLGAWARHRLMGSPS